MLHLKTGSHAVERPGTGEEVDLNSYMNSICPTPDVVWEIQNIWFDYFIELKMRKSDASSKFSGPREREILAAVPLPVEIPANVPVDAVVGL